MVKILKNVIVTLAFVTLMICNACLHGACGTKITSPEDEGQRESERERVKRIVEKELSYLAPMYDDIEPLKYGSCTFTSVKENADGGHTVKGEIYYTDEHGNAYSQAYRAEIDKGSWAPRIVRLDIEKLE
jgi:hypothetical protein